MTRNFDSYILHSSNISQEALQELKEKQSWSNVNLLTGWIITKIGESGEITVGMYLGKSQLSNKSYLELSLREIIAETIAIYSK